jgi:hypothetical protein
VLVICLIQVSRRLIEAYVERGVDCYVDFLDEVPSASQIKKDPRALFCMAHYLAHARVV